VIAGVGIVTLLLASGVTASALTEADTDRFTGEAVALEAFERCGGAF